jgi:predicted ThiF/HesA family dinucleotide-utilizing enzyme
MSQKLISHSPDLKRLQDEGYEIEIQNGFLLVHHVPYVNPKREIHYGILVSQLCLSGNQTSRPSNHVIFFKGEHPCDKNGNLIRSISHNNSSQILFGNFMVNHSFSNKPANGYNDYFEKVSTYAEIISAPAKAIDDSVSEKTFKVVTDSEGDSVFTYIDSNSSRANIYSISEKLENEKIGIVGLGGTGAYVLDFISKCPVKEIYLFDGDIFLQHNAFRTPGAASVDTLSRQAKKVQHFKEIYSNVYKNINAIDGFITEDNLSLLDGLTCVFICIDRGRIKKAIMNYLLHIGITFIDVGMGINKVDDTLIGTIRVTSATNSKNDHLDARVPFSDDKDDEYNTNIQIAELNALNAALAVIKWKKICGFYNDLENEHHTTYSINVSQLLNDEITT